MEYTIPHYFEKFRCVAAECEDSCCAGWAIMIDEASLEKYKNYQGAFGDRLRNSIDWENGSFCQYNKRCAFLNEDNLCDLHIEAGEHMLCNTCRDYPRHMEEFEGVREGSLSLSCIEAAKIILGCKEPVQFITLHDEVEDEEYEEFDYLLYTKLVDARTAMISFLQNREIDIMSRISMTLELAQKIQQAVDAEELYRVDELLEVFGTTESMLEFQKRTEKHSIGETEYVVNMRKLFRTFQKLEVLKADWPEYVKKAELTLFGEGRDAYERNRLKFHAVQGLKGTGYEEWANRLEQLMVYFVFVYFCGAVYDDNVLGKIQIGIISTLLIQELSIAKWLEQDKELSFHDFVDVAHRISREIEHSDLNLSRVEKMCEKNSVFETKNLVAMMMF